MDQYTPPHVLTVGRGTVTALFELLLILLSAAQERECESGNLISFLAQISYVMYSVLAFVLRTSTEWDISGWRICGKG